MDSDPKQRNQRHKRRDRAARMLKQKQAAQDRRGDVVSADEGDDSPIREKRPPTRKKRIKEPIFQEDIVDGFAFLSFKTYEDLEKTVNKYEKTSQEPSEPVLNNSHPLPEKQKTKVIKKKNGNEQKVKQKNFLNKVHNHKDTSSTNDENSRHGEEVNESPRSVSRDQLSDASSHASLERGYMCDSESGDDRGSDAESDLFNSKPKEKIFPTISKSSPIHQQSCRSPPLLPPVPPVQNDGRHPEPSMAVAAVTATTSPTNTVAAVVVSATSPQEPRVGSPAVMPLKCSSPLSHGGMVPRSSPFLHRGDLPPTPSSVSKDSASTSKFVSNGYDYVVSNHSTTSPVGSAKLQSPNKFLHKRTPPVSANRENTSVNMAAAINVYDFVSDHSAPSSPDGIIFLSQSKFHHKVGPPVSSAGKENTSDKITVSNGQPIISNNSTSSPVPGLTSPVSHTSHKNMKENVNVTKPAMCIKTDSTYMLSSAPTASIERRPPISSTQTRLPFSLPATTTSLQRPPSPLSSHVSIPPSSLSQSLSSSSSSSLPPSSLSSTCAVSSTLVTSSPSVVTITAPICTRASVTTSSTTITSTSSHTMLGRSSISPAVSASHPNTPTPIPARDTHSSHSNSSLSSLSQLSTPLHKDPNREGATSRSRSSSRNNTPSVSAASLSSSTTYAASSSLTNLVFSKPHNWVSSNANILSSSSSHVTPPLPPRPSSPSMSTSIPLPPSLHTAHHTVPFSTHSAPPPPPLLPVASHHGMFASPIPPGSLTPTLPLEPNAGPSPFRGESIFQPNPDLLRRELDTRFLASQDRSIPIPPPPYMQTEVHQHSHLHQQSTFLPPPLGSSLVSQPSPHLYDKFPKLDSSLYGRSSLGLSSYPGVHSSLFAPTGASTPFVPPGHLAALQPKINSTVKNKSMKPGKWCAMHVRIAWEIYNHQQKQKRAEAHKSGLPLSAATVKPPGDPMHPATHLFPSLPRPHDLSAFPAALLGAAGRCQTRSAMLQMSHPRTPYETSSHHSSFLNPTPAHLGVSPFARPGYPGFGTPGSSFTGLGTLGIPGTSMLGNELGASCLAQDPWAQRNPLSFSGAAPWGGLKEEAERERLQREEECKREEERQRRAEQEREKREKELERSRELERERKEQERQKERDREAHLLHQTRTSGNVQNGETREWDRSRERREISRSPVLSSHGLTARYDNTLDHATLQPRLEVKVKQERREDDITRGSNKISSHTHSLTVSDRERKRPSSIPHSEPENNQLTRTLTHHAVGVGLNSLERARAMGPLGLVPKDHQPHAPPPHSQVASLWCPLTQSTTVTTTIAGAGTDHFRNRDILQSRTLEQDRRYDPLQSVIPVSSHRNRCGSTELARQLAGPVATELECQMMDREHQAMAYDRSKLLPPPLRTNEPPYVAPPSLPTASVSGFFSPPVSPYLNNLCSSTVRTKTGPPGVTMNGLPPPLIPCTFPVQNHAGFHGNRAPSPLPHKLAAMSGSSVPNLHETYFPKERREVNGHPADLDSHLRL